MSEEIIISVISICFNNLPELQATLASVDMQEVKPFEHIIIDGSSNDQIRVYLENVAQPNYRRWISERDKGIADAFNKGVKMSSGTVLNMLNAGDTYQSSSVLSMVLSAFNSDNNLMWLHGMFQLKRGGLWVTIGKAFDPALLYRGMRSLSHQSMFVKKVLHDKYGFYDPKLRNAMDYDFVCRIAQEKFLFIPEPLITFAPGGTTDTNYLQALEEGRKVYLRYHSNSMQLVFWQARLKVLHSILNTHFGKLLYRIKVRLNLANA